MSGAVVDPREEAPAIRRAMVLLERVREDGADPELEVLADGIRTMKRAADEGRPIGHSALDRLEAVLARIAPPAPAGGDASVRDLLRFNALAETREILERLGH